MDIILAIIGILLAGSLSAWFGRKREYRRDSSRRLKEMDHDGY
jgi:LPXTG-motif cell wall-anchored protein